MNSLASNCCKRRHEDPALFRVAASAGHCLLVLVTPGPRRSRKAPTSRLDIVSARLGGKNHSCVLASETHARRRRIDDCICVIGNTNVMRMHYALIGLVVAIADADTLTSPRGIAVLGMATRKAARGEEPVIRGPG
jgi:hypothetical protein